jgi:squalene synthase HpnC
VPPSAAPTARTSPEADALARLEVDPVGPAPTLEDARAQVARLTTSHYENFSVLSRLVPADLRPDFAAVYAYCRWSDDLADETGSDDAAKARSLELLSRWRAQLQACHDFASGKAGADSPRHAVFVALADTMRRRSLPAEPFHHLLDAFEQDQRVTRYQTWDQVIGYCTRSADPVGRIILCLAGHRLDDPAAAELVRMSDATCTALQLINFWQDVRRDLLERDRVYIPSVDTGISVEMLRDWASRPSDPAARVPYIRAVRPLVERTRALFDVGKPLPRAMGGPLAPVVWLFGAGGRSVLAAVERSGCTTLWARPRLSKPRKVGLVLGASILSAVGAFEKRSGA